MFLYTSVWFFPLICFFVREVFSMGTLAMYPSFRLAHPNTLFAIYLVLSIRPVVYGILLHAYNYSILLLYFVLAPIIHTLPHITSIAIQNPDHVK